MNTYTMSQLKTKLTSIATATDKDSLQAVFVNTVYQSLVYGNNCPEQIGAVRNSNAPSAFKSGLLKHLPLSYNKGAGRYEYSRVRAEKLRTQLGIELANEKEFITVDELAAKLPDLFAKKEAKTLTEFDPATYAARVAKQLGDAGVVRAVDVADILLLLLTKDGAITAAQVAIIAGTAKADAESAAA